MKVDILGRGIVPGLGVLAPLYGKDLTETELDKILKQSALKIYLTGSKVPVIRRNLHQIIMMNAGTSKVDVSVKPVKKEEKVTPIAEPVKEEPASVEPVAEEAPAVEETVAEEPVAVEETPVVEEAVVEEKPVQQQTSSKKKNRK